MKLIYRQPRLQGSFFSRFRKFDGRALPPFPVIGPFNVAFPALISREAPYRGPYVREKERPSRLIYIGCSNSN